MTRPTDPAQPALLDRLRPAPRTLVAWTIAVTLCLAWDRAVWLGVSVHDPSRLAAMESKDWYRLLRIGGYFGTWLAAAAAFVLFDAAALARATRRPETPRPDGWWRRGAFCLAAPALAGAAAELLKPLVGRYRPGEPLPTGASPDGWFVFAPLGDRFSAWSDNMLGMASSHAAVAFAGAAAVGLMLPPLRPILYALALGCALTRILAGAHFFSDACVGAAFGVAAAHALWIADAPARHRRLTAGPTPADAPPTAPTATATR